MIKQKKTSPESSRAVSSLLIVADDAPTASVAWFPCGRLSSRVANRLCLLFRCATAGPRPDSVLSAVWLVIRNQHVTARASRLTSVCSSADSPTMPCSPFPRHGATIAHSRTLPPPLHRLSSL